MKIRLVLILSLILVLLSVSAYAADVQVNVLAAEQRVKSGTTETLSFELPKIADGEQVRLALDVRVDWPGLEGYNPWMDVVVNGKAVTGPDLINKPLEFTTRDGSDSPGWYRYGHWTIIYSPDFSDKIRTAMLPWGFPDVDPYHYVWDITPYVKSGSNTVAFTHIPLLAEGTTMVMRNVEIEAGPAIKSLNVGNSGMPIPAPVGPLPTYVVKRPKAIHLDVSMSLSGSIKLGVGVNTFDVSSRTSEPNGKWVTTDTQSWHRISRGKTAHASWSGTGYTVSRRVTLRDDHVQVSDTISNTSDKLIGVIYENQVDLSGKDKPELLLGGNRPCLEFGSESPAHPSAIALWKDLALGLFAEDDIFRIHNRAYGDDKVLSISDPRLGIAPGQSHTLEWSIYPVPKGDYWDVINAVRRNWGSNITILGPGNFEAESDRVKTPEYYKEYAESRGLKLVFTGQTYFREDGNLAEGTAIPTAKEWCAGTAEWVKMFHAADPSIKTMVYLHPSNCTEADAQKLYADSRLLDASGKQVTSPYRYPIYEYISSLDNSYGKALFKTMLSMFDTMKMDGIFMDEICRGSVPEYAYNTQWDGCTVEIDRQTHGITRQYSSVVLLEHSWKNAMVKYMKEHGKLLVGNSPCYTRTMLDWKMPMFTEIGSYSFLAETHLSTPLALGTHDMENGENVRTTMVRKSLDYAGLLYMYNWGDAPKGFHYMHVMFPTTPEELHAGMILGKERIVTNRSGRYGWQDGKPGRAYVIDGEGKLVLDPQVKEIRENGKWFAEIRMPSDHFAILVKK